mmetsp:Transcript_10617/g.30668  ORF Transcript_10617/g.30668 Transcript_10617/m.30668 type:complete len:228 (+) Transcript_10617:169-852(+)
MGALRCAPWAGRYFGCSSTAGLGQLPDHRHHHHHHQHHTASVVAVAEQLPSYVSFQPPPGRWPCVSHAPVGAGLQCCGSVQLDTRQPVHVGESSRITGPRPAEAARDLTGHSGHPRAPVCDWCGGWWWPSRRPAAPAALQSSEHQQCPVLRWSGGPHAAGAPADGRGPFVGAHGNAEGPPDAATGRRHHLRQPSGTWQPDEPTSGPPVVDGKPCEPHPVHRSRQRRQ